MPTARQQLEEAMLYIAIELSAPDAAFAFVDEVDAMIQSLARMPYRHPLYHSRHALESEVRFVPVKNYNIFYVVNDAEKTVEIRRVLYQRQDTNR